MEKKKSVMATPKGKNGPGDKGKNDGTTHRPVKGK